MLHSKLFNHGPLTRRLLPLLIPQRAVKSLVLLGVIFTTIMAGRMGDGGSVAAAPSQTAAPATINVRVAPASPSGSSAGQIESAEDSNAIGSGWSKYSNFTRRTVFVPRARVGRQQLFPADSAKSPTDPTL